MTPIIFLFNIDFPYFVGSVPTRGRDYCIWSNFWKFYLIKIGFTLGELVSLVKVFRLFKLEQMFFCCSRVWTHKVDAQHLIYWQGHCVCDALFCFQVFSSCSYVFPYHIIIVIPHSFFKVPQNVLNLLFYLLMQFPNIESFFYLTLFAQS